MCRQTARARARARATTNNQTEGLKGEEANWLEAGQVSCLVEQLICEDQTNSLVYFGSLYPRLNSYPLVQQTRRAFRRADNKQAILPMAGNSNSRCVAVAVAAAVAAVVAAPI